MVSKLTRDFRDYFTNVLQMAERDTQIRENLNFGRIMVNILP